MSLKILEQEAQDKYISIVSSSLALLIQQCKIEWIKYGDDCTRFFFARVKQRNLTTYVDTIQDATGAEVEGFEQVGEVMLSFYKDLLGQTPLRRHPIDPSILSQGSVLSPEQQLDLWKPFNDKDIKDAMFSIPSHKSPGPEGFSNGFFKTTWNIIGPMVCACLLYTSPSPRDGLLSRMPSSA